MTEQEAVQKLNEMCMDCGKYISPQRSACASCQIELCRQTVVYGIQLQKQTAAEVGASTTT